MKKLKLVVSDFHLGRGRRLPNGAINMMEDFLYDHRFQQFLEYHTSEQYEDADVELIFNGDMLNLIQTDYHGHYPFIITEAISYAKAKAIIDGHQVFFKSLRDFLNHPKHSLTYVVGNHDQEMMWKSVRTLFEQSVGKEVNWKNTYYLVDGIHIEHGHQYEAINRIDPTQPFLNQGLPEPIVNLPWGSLFTIQFITKIKVMRPVVDKVRPFRMLIWWSLMHDTWLAIISLIHLISYFLTTRFTRNRYRRSNLKLTLKMLTEASVFPDVTDAAKRILRTPEIHSVIFGHTHVYKVVQVGDEKQYINTGTWTDIISLDLESYARRSRLTYVRAEYEDSNPRPVVLLRHWIGRIPLEDDALGV
jgi:UDP-2,3-diacylglucosamine pyrophosphatase LpxH